MAWTAEYRKAYNTIYGKAYKKAKGRMSSVVVLPDNFIINTMPKTLDLDGNRPSCVTFGCGRQLSSIEYMAGNVCTKHMGIHQTVNLNAGHERI